MWPFGRKKWVGWATLNDGHRVEIPPREVEHLWRDVERANAERACQMPTDTHALRVMMDAFVRLKELGWREAIYCPKDGSWFDAIEAGSTGIFRCHYEGKWPDGRWWIADDHDLCPAHPILFRLDPEAEAARQAELEAFRAAAIARDGRP